MKSLLSMIENPGVMPLVSEKYNIAKRTLQDGELEKRKCPVYVHELLERAVKDDYNMLSELEKESIRIVSKKVMELDKDDLTEQEIIDNRFL